MVELLGRDLTSAGRLLKHSVLLSLFFDKNRVGL